MILLRLGLVAAVGLASCVESDRRPAPETEVGADSDDGDDGDGAGEDADDDVAVDTAPETETAECGTDEACPQPLEPCMKALCQAGSCGIVDADVGDGCDDGDPCTGEGHCARIVEPCPETGCSLVCEPGDPVEDGTDCDADHLVCNGSDHCENGTCVIALTPECHASDNPCASGSECSEDAGRCVDVPVDDGLECLGPPDATDAESWQCSIGRCVPPDMVVVPAGAYRIGCPDQTGGNCRDDNVPAHLVRLSSFAIDLVEMSEGEFRRCRDDLDQRGMSCGIRDVESRDDVVQQTDAMPLRWIDWLGAFEMCAYQGKRLCTEAEWEVGARGSGSAFFPWGNQPATCEKATFNRDGAGCGTDMPSEVGLKPLGASPYGVLDMAGNVGEWCADYYRRDVYEEQAESLPLDPVQSEQAVTDAHVVRGGGYKDGFGPIRTFERSAHPSDGARDDLGVRCCLSLEEL